MDTENMYHQPIDLRAVTSTQRDSVAHVGDLIHAIDYDAPEGTPVYAALDGIVVAIKDDSCVGGDNPEFEEHANYIEILHDHHEISEYEHLRQHSSKVAIGDRIATGDILAEVGNTGWSECPHLHFMVYPKDHAYQTRRIRFQNRP
ncbi:M23 family metallopeptidase [Candidatus Uhrbacteria bacterium]|nr:M23 family metallopeptidase [Candidatus Uhrbacteria bacterium]